MSKDKYIAYLENLKKELLGAFRYEDIKKFVDVVAEQQRNIDNNAVCEQDLKAWFMKGLDGYIQSARSRKD